MDRILAILSSNPFETPANISNLIHTEMGIHLGPSTVRFWMKRRGMSLKKTSRLITNDRIEGQRLVYARDYSSVYDPERVVSIDESSFYFDMKPAKGYCHRSNRLVVPARPGGRTRWSLLMAVTNERVVGWKLVKGSIDSAKFTQFVQSLETDGRDVMLMDNASIHKTHRVQDAIISRGLTPCFLPPYTPEFQPIEHCFFIIKNTFRKLRVCSEAVPSDEIMVDRLKKCLDGLTPMTLSRQFSKC